MLSKIPRNIVNLSLALPLALAAPRFSADVTNNQLAISLGVREALAAGKKPPLDCKPYDAERLIEGANLRIVRVHGNNLKEMHDCAAKEFIAWLETMIKNPQNRLTLGNFKTDIWYEDGTFHFAYIITVVPAENASEVHRVVDMRGTVQYGTNAKAKALRINKKKIPPWQKRMKNAYPNMKLWYEKATMDTVDMNGIPIFHEAVLVKGAPL